MYFLFRTVDRTPTKLLNTFLMSRRDALDKALILYPEQENLALYFFTMTDEGGVMVEVEIQ